MNHKTIHYCWFGGNPMPELVKQCMVSWKKYCPDYEIIEWNESNFDVNCCDYVKEAYESKKWAFVSDYCRFWVLYKYGGIYLDTDVELIRPINDLPDTFVGFENPTTCNSGLIRAALAGDEICELMLTSYHADRFIYEHGDLNLKTVCERETEILERLGLKRDGSLQVVKNTTVYPCEYFCPKSYSTEKIELTQNTYSIHHYNASWYGETELYAMELRQKWSRFLPRKIAGVSATLVAKIKFEGWGACYRYVKGKLKRKS